VRLLVSIGAPAAVGAPLQPAVLVVDLPTWSWVERWPLAPVRAPSGGDHAGVPAQIGTTLLQPTRSAVLRLDLQTGAPLGELSIPAFSDLHSVTVAPDGALLVASTGNELVVELDASGDERRRWALGAPVPPGRDDRALHHAALKPHRRHPNHAVRVGERVLVTCLETRDCVDVDDASFRVPLPEGPPHDGSLVGDLLWFTTTNGWIIAAEAHDGRRALALDLAELDPGRGLAGWCRGVAVDGDRLWVGLSQLRRSALREAARRALRGEAGRKRPARIIEIDLRSRRVVRELAVPDPAGAEIYGLTLVRPGDVP